MERHLGIQLRIRTLIAEAGRTLLTNQYVRLHETIMMERMEKVQVYYIHRYSPAYQDLASDRRGRAQVTCGYTYDRTKGSRFFIVWFLRLNWRPLVTWGCPVTKPIVQNHISMLCPIGLGEVH